MLCPFLKSKLFNSHILDFRNEDPPTLSLKTCISRRTLQTSNYKRNPCKSKFYSPQLALCHSGLLDCPRAKALGQSNALVPQIQFCAVKPYFTGSTYIVISSLVQLPTPQVGNWVIVESLSHCNESATWTLQGFIVHVCF
jgi:hypothetical protein